LFTIPVVLAASENEAGAGWLAPLFGVVNVTVLPVTVTLTALEVVVAPLLSVATAVRL
jgi:hypothetical protein